MKSILLPLALCVLLQSTAFGQRGYSSATMGMMQHESSYDRYKAGTFSSDAEKDNYRKASILELIPGEIIPEEIINYHSHLIAMPAKGQQVNVVPEITQHPFFQDHFLLQIGIAGDTVIPENRTAIGMMYVLDISGSMGDGKLECAKKALIASLDALVPTDYFGFVIFDNTSQVVIPYALLGSRKQEIIASVNALSTRGGTDILKGLNEGLDAMAAVTIPDVAQTLVIITDGNTNTGTTEREAILQNLMVKTNHKIRITTLGVGIDLRYDLLRDISERTHGQFHYIERYEDIQKVCVDEFGSIALPIGKEVVLKITLPGYLTVKNIYGADNVKINGNELEISLKDLNYFLTQVVLVDLAFNSNYKLHAPDVKTQLSYASYMTGNPVVLKPVASYVSQGESAQEALFNDVLKNFLIAEWAYQFKGVAAAYRKSNDEAALKTNLENMLGNPLAGYAPIGNDKDILRLKTVFENLWGVLL